MTANERARNQDRRQRSTTPGTELGGMFPRAFAKDYVTIVRGDGSWVWDGDDNRYLDAISGNQNVNIGHGREAIADAAHEQIERLEYTSSMLFANEPAMEYTEKIAEFTPDGFEHTWLVSSGSEANESAIKLARQYHYERGNEGKYKVISRRRSYHGNTAGAMAVSGFPARKTKMEPLFANFPKAPSATPYRCERCDGDGGRACGRECADAVERLIQDEGPETVAAFIAEPVTGAANAAASPHDGYFERIREICDEYDVLFIVDEVMAGFGRTGENFAIEHWDVTPDIITGAKGMSGGYSPIGGTMPHRRVTEVFEDVEDGFQHGHTFCFNPASAAIGTAVLEYMDEHNLVSNAREVGAYLRERCEEFYEYEFVGDVRGKGLMLGVEFVGDRETKEPLPETGGEFQSLLFETGLDNGIVTYPGGGHVDGQYGDHTLITPPLTIDEELADEVVDRMHATFTDLEGALS
ncbi:aminotransferase family protein [Natrialba swarupiae]|uniref:Aspartate aminotransferase family protein n=1 Tax=Natrialba swarupiae TaxID=2448032 RepID=A0A5D5AG96_9EURY|nr:aspartate aminotransferase family protein [Natrialba swarupiae]TYT60819.1 aspartate aminotransferase family protein [Natrialba swarupiae]